MTAYSAQIITDILFQRHDRLTSPAGDGVDPDMGNIFQQYAEGCYSADKGVEELLRLGFNDRQIIAFSEIWVAAVNTIAGRHALAYYTDLYDADSFDPEADMSAIITGNPDQPLGVEVMTADGHDLLTEAFIQELYELVLADLTEMESINPSLFKTEHRTPAPVGWRPGWN